MLPPVHREAWYFDVGSSRDSIVTKTEVACSDVGPLDYVGFSINLRPLFALAPNFGSIPFWARIISPLLVASIS